MAAHCRKQPRTRKRPLNISKSRRAAKRSEAAGRDFWNICSGSAEVAVFAALCYNLRHNFLLAAKETKSGGRQ
jgi:hypothetical protein